MSLTIMGRDTATNKPVEITVTGGKLDVNASVTPPEGGATEAKQDAGNTSLSAINGKLPTLSGGKVPVVDSAIAALLPAALTGGGGVKVGLVDALPAGTAVLGSVVAANSSGTATFPTASALSNSSAGNPTTTKIGAVCMGREENGDTLRRLRCTAQNDLYVQPLAIGLSTTSRTSGTSYEAQRGVNFGCSLAFVRVYSKTAGYILLVNKSSAAANGDAPFGADAFKIAADSTIQIDMSGCSEAFTSGCQVVFSSTPEQVTLPGTSDIRVTIIGN